MIVGVLLISALALGPTKSDIETPDYKVVESKENIETREYAPMIIAVVETKGEGQKARGNGFRLLADYIFGNNTVRQKIAMTAPVQQQQSRKIAMTAPVQQQAAGDSWQVSFVMPSKYTLATLPTPNNKAVTLKEVPAKKFVVIRFSGKNSDKNVMAHEKKLMDYIKAQEIKIIGSPKYAFYNPPWTPPEMRRNEVMVEIEP